MRLLPILVFAPLLALATAPLAAQQAGQQAGPPAGRIGTVERGHYVCELPGDAGGAVGVHQPQEDFRVASASRYRTPEGDGTYLRRGDVMTMTNGPRAGAQYAVISPTFLRKMDNGAPGRLRCYRRER